MFSQIAVLVVLILLNAYFGGKRNSIYITKRCKNRKAGKRGKQKSKTNI